MSKDAQSILAILLGWSALCFVFAYSDRAESAQKIDNIERLYQIKRSLNIERDAIYIDSLDLEITKKIDSLMNIK